MKKWLRTAELRRVLTRAGVVFAIGATSILLSARPIFAQSWNCNSVACYLSGSGTVVAGNPTTNGDNTGFFVPIYSGEDEFGFGTTDSSYSNPFYNPWPTGPINYIYSPSSMPLFLFLGTQANQRIEFQSNQTAFMNGNVGIGTTTPGTLLDLLGGDVRAIAPNNGFVIQAPDYWSGGWARGLNFTNSANTVLAQFGAYGSGAPSSLNYAYIGTGPTSTWMTFLSNGRVGIGTTNPQYPLSVNGTVQAKEVLVNTGWSDYVFDPNYKMAPLGEVANYIKANHHLPEIPSAKEVEDRGVGLGEMQAKLLAKIEELTLHMIEADRENKELRKENERTRARLLVLESEGKKR